MKLFVIEIMSEKKPVETRKLSVHAADQVAAEQMVLKKYTKWSVTSTHEIVGPAAICFEEGWWE